MCGWFTAHNQNSNRWTAAAATTVPARATSAAVASMAAGPDPVGPDYCPEPSGATQSARPTQATVTTPTSRLGCDNAPRDCDFGGLNDQDRE